MIAVREAHLRAHPRFQLVPFDRLDGAERQAFASLGEERDFYGLLVPPPGSGLPIKSVSRDAALLFLTLREPARVPHLIASLFGGSADGQLRQLVLDGVFEIEHEGRFLSGAAALPLLGGAGGGAAAVTRVAGLSAQAIAHAAAFHGLPVAQLAARLYMFNRAPCTPRLQRRFADDERLVAHLVGDDEGVRAALGTRWTREASQEGWLTWRTAAAVPRLGFKLYVSPTLEHLAPAFRLSVEAFARVGCPQFKIGRKAFGLVRPDKLVAYFGSLEQLKEAAELILATAAGVAAQGVPFTAAIDAGGLVSWGMDPPRFEQVLEWQAHQSWRQWLAERIAVYILAAKDSGAERVEDFVRSRVALDGVDTGTWSPNLAIWRGPGVEVEST